MKKSEIVSECVLCGWWSAEKGIGENLRDWFNAVAIT